MKTNLIIATYGTAHTTINKKYEDMINIIIIPSYINSKHTCYTSDERFNQTKKTITSVREKIPNSYIVFIDISELNSIQLTYLNQNCDLVLNETNNQELIQKVNSGKSYGEKNYIQYALLKLNEFDRNYGFNKFKNVKSVFKITGRYFLNNSFNYLNYDNDYDVVNIISQEKYANACQSCFFKITTKNIKKFVEILETYDNQILYNHIDMEKLLYIYIQNTLEQFCFLHINKLGLTAVPTNGKQTHSEELFNI